MIILSINEEEYKVQSEDSLNLLINNFNKNEFNEIWVFGPGESKLNILTNKDRAFLMYLRYDGDSGFSSRTSLIHSDDEIEFKLSNGQTDVYPANRTVSTEVLREVLIEYYRTENKSENLIWDHN